MLDKSFEYLVNGTLEKTIEEETISGAVFQNERYKVQYVLRHVINETVCCTDPVWPEERVQ